ncbi:NYN domain-containing protein [Gynuella sp.]|uniref:LabA-like NYN domain-containing protein n=1 Tax=Gynuella sp. TaxID=2969146 RepID=UPI003D13C470
MNNNKTNNRIAVFVDVQNIYYTVKHTYHCHFDYHKFWSDISSQGDIVKAVAYASDRNCPRQIAFQSILRNIGFEVKLRPYIQRRDGSTKADWDVGITIDIIDFADQVDTIILASGDGDFQLLANYIRERFNKDFNVYGVPSLTAHTLVEAASNYHPISEQYLLKH